LVGAVHYAPSLRSVARLLLALALESACGDPFPLPSLASRDNGPTRVVKPLGTGACSRTTGRLTARAVADLYGRGAVSSQAAPAVARAERSRQR